MGGIYTIENLLVERLGGGVARLNDYKERGCIGLKSSNILNQKQKDKINEVVRLITIEKRLGKTSITKEDADFVKALSDTKHYPRAEYVLARMYLCGYQIEQDKAMGMKYLARSSRHAGYDLQLKIAYMYHVLGETKTIKECLKSARDDCI